MVGSAFSSTVSSIDFTPIEGTQWGQPSVRLNFGSAGTGTVLISSINGGSFLNAATPFGYNDLAFSSYNGPSTLSDGSIFAPTQESVFSIIPSAAAGLSGFSITITLDSGVFDLGSRFSVRSLGASTTTSNSQYFEPVSGLLIPDSVQLPTDGSANADLVLLPNGSYGPAESTTASRGLAFEISGGTFTANFLSTTGYQPGGVAFTLVTPDAIPEPTTGLLAGIFATGMLLKRRRA